MDNNIILPEIAGDFLNNPTDWKTLLYLNKSGQYMEIFRILDK